MKKLIITLLLGILLVNFALALERGADTSTFTNTYTGWTCQKNSVNASWINYELGTKVDVMLKGVMAASPVGNCSLYSADFSGVCCPSDKPYCWPDGQCRGGGEFCSNYNSSASCSVANSGNSLVGQNSVNNGSKICGEIGYSPVYKLLDVRYGPDPADCFNYTDCSCFWDTSVSKCVGRAAPMRYCQNSTIGVEQPYDGFCTWTTPSDAGSLGCDVSGVITYASRANWTVIPGGNPAATSLARTSCTDIVRTYTCPETNKLPFFGMFNLLISAIIIGFIYFFYRRN